MTPREDGHQELLDDVVLAHDLAGHLLPDLVVGRAQLFQLGEIELFGRGAQDRVPQVGQAFQPDMFSESAWKA